MEAFLTVLHILVCLLLVAVILLQPGKSPGMGGAFGGMSATANFGAKSPTTVLSRITVVFAVGFMVTSLALAWMGVRDHAIVIGDDDAPALRLPEAEPAPEAGGMGAPETGGMGAPETGGAEAPPAEAPPVEQTPPAADDAALEAAPSPPEPVEQAAPLDPADD
jgi:preprotein translocase subunit SecG